MHIILFLLALTYKTLSLSCTAQWQCSSVTTDYNYVTCTNGLCQCLTVNGFIGNATTSFLCQCTSPDSVYWLNGAPYCINYTDAANCENQQAQDAYQIAVVQAVFQAAIYPGVVTVMQNLIAGIPDATFNLFSNTSVGRWVPFGVFNDPVSLVESFYGLLWKPSDTVSGVTFKKLISQGNIVYVKVDYHINATDDGISYHQFNLTHGGSFTFN